MELKIQLYPCRLLPMIAHPYATVALTKLEDCKIAPHRKRNKVFPLLPIKAAGDFCIGVGGDAEKA